MTEEGQVGDGKDVYYMGERVLAKLIKDVNTYATSINKNETKAQSREALIRTGVLDKNGKVTQTFKRAFE